MQRGIVSGRVALLPRSTEIQPLLLRFVPPIQNLFKFINIIYQRVDMYVLVRGKIESDNTPRMKLMNKAR